MSQQHWRMNVFLTCIIAGVFLHISMVRAESGDDCFLGVESRRLESCTQVIEDPNTSPTDRLDALIIRGQMQAMNRRYPEALRDFDEAIAVDPQSAVALNNRAWAHYKWKRSTVGLADVEEALRLAPASAPSWDTRAHLRQILGDFTGAFNDYEAAIGIGGNSFVTLYQCGLKERGLYNGPVDGVYSVATRAALRTCALSSTCDPLPENEFIDQCNSVSS